MGGSLERGESSRSACSARSLCSPLAPLSLAPLAGASGWRLVVLLRRVVTLLLVAPFASLGRTPPLRFALAVVAAARLAARRSCAVGRLRSLPACRSLPRPGLRRLPLRVCAPCPHRRLRARCRARHLVFRRCGGVVGYCCSLGGCSCVARLVLLCVVLFLRSRRRRAFPAVAASLPSLRFPAAPQLSRAALLHSSAPLRRALSSLRSAPVIRSQRAAPSAVALCRLPLWSAAARSARHCARAQALCTRVAAAPRAGK